ncbi:phage tail protein [Pseudescherichia sp.]|uniref:phage tail fiber protein n=1 Tax=Pseudescherichia sp. TaxID=2055881 RepID=UPI002897E47C|nr:phage tail protein [Pseudescherichia sp.]
MIYTTGTIAGSGNTLTGTGTNFTAAGSLIRNGCTVIVLTSPPQAFQITDVTSATQLAVSPAVNPAIPAGTRYSILLSDSLSVDGLALDIAETFGMYQRYMGGFADVMNGTGIVTITINGVSVKVPGMQSVAQKSANGAVPLAQGGTGATDAAGARNNMELGTASTRNVQSSLLDTTSGAMLQVNSFGLGATNSNILSNANLAPATGFYGGSGQANTNFFDAFAPLLHMYRSPTTSTQLQIGMDARLSVRSINSGTVVGWRVFWSDGNTIVDTNGFIKRASPVVKIRNDGSSETNDESEGVTVTRQAVGVYLVEGCLGLNSDAAWGGIDGGFEIPKDRNGQALVWLDYEVNADGSISVKTYHRTYPDAPEFARNERDGYASGDPIDIPADQFVSVRVEMPENSIYNQKRLAAEALAIKDAENTDQSINPDNQ